MLLLVKNKFNISDAVFKGLSQLPMGRVVIDTLHLFLRISDVLTQLLIQDLRIADCIEKIKSSRKGLIEPNIHIWQSMSNL